MNKMLLAMAYALNLAISIVRPAHAQAPQVICQLPTNGTYIPAGACGAKPDSDSVLGINAALRAAAERHKAAATLAAGIYFADTTSILVPANVCLRGAGQKKTIIRAGTNSGFPSVILAGSNACISDLTIDGNSKSAGKRGSDGVRVIWGAKNAAVHDIEVLNTADNGIESNSTNVRIYSNFVHDNYTNGIYVIGNDSDHLASDTDIYNNKVSGNSKGTIRWDGIDCDPNTLYCNIHNNEVTGNDIILYGGAVSNDVTASRGHIVQANVITNSDENCFDISGAVQGATLKFNKCSHVTGYGVLINTSTPQGVQQMSNITLWGNYYSGTTKDGILVTSFAQAEIQASIAGQVLTVAQVSSGQVSIGEEISGAGVVSKTRIVSPLEEINGKARYTVNVTQTIPLTAMTLSGRGPDGVRIIDETVADSGPGYASLHINASTENWLVSGGHFEPGSGSYAINLAGSETGQLLDVSTVPGAVGAILPGSVSRPAGSVTGR